MRAVGIKVLKAKLSEYIRAVKSGETILVTERDEVVAEIKPAHRKKAGVRTLDDALVAMAERGEATLSTSTLKGWKGFRKKLRFARGSSQEILDDLREDRR